MLCCIFASLRAILTGLRNLTREDSVGIVVSHVFSIVILLSTITATTYCAKNYAVKRLNRALVRSKKQSREKNLDRIRQKSKDFDLSCRWVCYLTFNELLHKLQSSELLPSYVLRAYQLSALEAQEKYNCVTTFITEAASWAADLDSRVEKRKDFPLFGIPFSVKDSFDIEGYDSTSGLARNIGHPAKQTCNVVAHLRSLGAIPFVKTNTPQGLIGVSCNNPLFGLTLNPVDTNRSLGGSSSGCAALVAANGAPFAVGSDIGGSLRMPAAAVGVASIKFCSKRLVLEHASPYVGGAPALLNLGYGFIAKEVTTIETVAEAIMQAEFFEIAPYTAPIPYCPVRKPRLRIGYFTSTSWYHCIPPNARAVRAAAAALRAAGHTVIPFEFPRAIHAHILAQRTLMQENTVPYSLFNGEDISPDQHVYKLTTLPWVYYTVGGWIFSILGDWRMATQVRIKNKSQTHAMSGFAEVAKYKQEFIRSMGSLDAIVCPAGTVVTPKLEHLERLVPTNGFLQMVFNMLDLPAGIVAATTVTEDDVLACSKERYERLDKMDAYCAKTSEEGEGLPVGVQIVARPFHEEVCLKVMRDVVSFRSVDEGR